MSEHALSIYQRNPYPAPIRVVKTLSQSLRQLWIWRDHHQLLARSRNDPFDVKANAARRKKLSQVDFSRDTFKRTQSYVNAGANGTSTGRSKRCIGLRMFEFRQGESESIEGTGERTSSSASPQSTGESGRTRIRLRGQLAQNRPYIEFLVTWLRLEVLAAWRSAENRSRTPGADPADEQAESAIGSAADPWRTVDARDRRQRIDCVWRIADFGEISNSPLTELSHKIVARALGAVMTLEWNSIDKNISHD